MDAPAALHRDTRYAGLVDMDALNQRRHIVVGVGAIGRNVATTLASMGIMKIDLIDFDEVETHNMGNQGYRPDQIGQPKVEATKADLDAINPDGEFRPSHRGWDPSMDCDTDAVVYVCVDNMAVRKEIAESKVYHTCYLAGMARWDYDVFGIEPDQCAWYVDNHWAGDDDVPDLPCTERATLMLAQRAASDLVTLAAAHYSKHIKLPLAAHSQGLRFRQWKDR